MKINLSFIPQNTAPLGARSIGLYDSNGNKLRNIQLGNLAPKSTGNILYRFGALSDVHLPYNTGPEDFARALNYFNNTENVDFICISGDMGSTGTDAEWASFKNYVDTYSPNTTVHISAGNHDAGQSAHKTYDYPIPYTGNPLYYSFTQGDDVFIMFGMTFAVNTPFSKESLQWLYETLEENRNKRCFVFQHMMRKGHAGDASGRYTFDGLNNTNGKVFLSLMEHYKNVLWFHGHSHNEFEHQDTLALPNSNYDRAFGCHSIHIPSCCATRNEDNGYDYEDSEGYIIDVYKNGIHLRGRDFVAEKFLPIASYWIDTTLEEIKEKTYVDSHGVIKPSNKTEEPPVEEHNGITLPKNTTYTLNARDSYSGKATKSESGMVRFLIPCEADTIYKLSVENLPIDITSSSSKGNTGALFCWDTNKTNVSTIKGRENSSIVVFINVGDATVTNNNKSFSMNLTTSDNAGYISLSLVISTTKDITEDDIKNIIIALEKN